jgi:hypothetical protein
MSRRTWGFGLVAIVVLAALNGPAAAFSVIGHLDIRHLALDRGAAVVNQGTCGDIGVVDVGSGDADAVLTAIGDDPQARAWVRWSS